MSINDAAARGFERGADDYERARPGYPDAAIALVAEELAVGPGTALLDLAAGTGKLTRQLAPYGADIVAVEPVAAMRRKLQDVLPDLDVRDGTAEAIPVADRSIDVVTCAQAFHWFAPQPALDEMARVLRAGGGIALIWNVRDESVSWIAELTELLVDESGGTPYRRDYRPDRWQRLIEDHGGFTPVEHRAFRHEQVVDVDTVVARAASTSYVSAMADEPRAALLGRVRAMLESHPELSSRERFDFPHECDVYWCHRR